ncbi:hypothetical protein Cgig2_012819 [Carnegiea gigantea]|uniref:Endonuclease/exonuclease/phosphatase domain-containing protein n=1 Tax=Carnegiea gigantea TaxID=171969 RepID=A0A9Q1GHW8_9CARY|nr:hypothetical protein Cgig2_012819 [Carnegiea gigantea]
MTDQAAVVQRGVYFFDNKPFIVKPWREDLNLNTENLATLPVWVRFPYLEVKYWGPDSLSKLGSLLGIPIKIDKFTRDKTILKYARLLIEMKLQDNFPEYIDFVNEHDMVIISQSDQMIHCKATHIATMKNFFISFVYGANHETQRRQLWEDLIHIAQDMEEAWCILGDFNAVLYPGDRIGGTEVQYHEIKNFSECMFTCEVQELQSNGPYYTWTNKTIWTRINRVFVNTYWYNIFALSHLTYMANSLSDHTAMMLSFPWCPKPKSSFQFCDMWIRDPSFLPLMSSIAEHLHSHNPTTNLKQLLQQAKRVLQKLNKESYADLKAQLKLSENPGDTDLAQQVEESRVHYIQILSSVIDIIKQQSKAD